LPPFVDAGFHSRPVVIAQGPVFSVAVISLSVEDGANRKSESDDLSLGGVRLILAQLARRNRLAASGMATTPYICKLD
jgi:hypothetical protein